MTDEQIKLILQAGVDNKNFKGNGKKKRTNRQDTNTTNNDLLRHKQ